MRNRSLASLSIFLLLPVAALFGHFLRPGRVIGQEAVAGFRAVWAALVRMQARGDLGFGLGVGEGEEDLDID